MSTVYVALNAEFITSILLTKASTHSKMTCAQTKMHSFSPTRRDSSSEFLNIQTNFGKKKWNFYKIFVLTFEKLPIHPFWLSFFFFSWKCTYISFESSFYSSVNLLTYTIFEYRVHLKPLYDKHVIFRKIIHLWLFVNFF